MTEIERQKRRKREETVERETRAEERWESQKMRKNLEGNTTETKWYEEGRREKEEKEKGVKENQQRNINKIAWKEMNRGKCRERRRKKETLEEEKVIDRRET